VRRRLPEEKGGYTSAAGIPVTTRREEDALDTAPSPVPCAKAELFRTLAVEQQSLPARVKRAARRGGVVHVARRAAQELHIVARPPAVVVAPVRRTRLPRRADESLGLRPGEVVEVKSAEEIRGTLDEADMCRGLLFMTEMWKYCGTRHAVLKPVRTIMVETTGELREGVHDTVLLAGSNCDGSAHGDCDVFCYHLWRESWLRRLPPESAPDEETFPPADE
jgi:hypothetical protein